MSLHLVRHKKIAIKKNKSEELSIALYIHIFIALNIRYKKYLVEAFHCRAILGS